MLDESTARAAAGRGKIPSTAESLRVALNRLLFGSPSR
jgi:hypothetical protein